MKQCQRIVKKYSASVKHGNYKADFRCCFVITSLINVFIAMVWKVLTFLLITLLGVAR